MCTRHGKRYRRGAPYRHYFVNSTEFYIFVVITVSIFVATNVLFRFTKKKKPYKKIISHDSVARYSRQIQFTIGKTTVLFSKIMYQYRINDALNSKSSSFVFYQISAITAHRPVWTLRAAQTSRSMTFHSVVPPITFSLRSALG